MASASRITTARGDPDFERSGLDGSNKAHRWAGADLEIFRQSLVIRERGGWQITAEGRELLASIETPAVAEAEPAQPIETARLPDATPVPLIGINRRRHRRRDRRAPRPIALLDNAGSPVRRLDQAERQ